MFCPSINVPARRALPQGRGNDAGLQVFEHLSRLRKVMRPARRHLLSLRTDSDLLQFDFHCF